MVNLRLPQKLRDPFTALLLFGAAGIVAMILAFAITSLPRLGAPTQAPATGAGTQSVPSAPPIASPSPSAGPAQERGHGHKKD